MGWARTDDLDGSPAEQRTFGLDGKAYTIDLSDPNATKLLKALQPFLTVAQVYGEMPTPPEFPGQASPAVPRGPRGKQSVAPEQKTIRQWAITEGYAVSTKGRIPEAVINAYTEAHP